MRITEVDAEHAALQFNPHSAPSDKMERRAYGRALTDFQQWITHLPGCATIHPIGTSAHRYGTQECTCGLHAKLGLTT